MIRALIVLILTFQYALSFADGCLPTVLNYLLIKDNLRTQDSLALIKKYKNDPHFASFLDAKPNLLKSEKLTLVAFESAKKKKPISPRPPRTLDLEDSSLTDFVPLDECDVCDLFPNGYPPGGWSLSRYEMEVIRLRKGDSIKYKGRTIELGKFLGAGDATHIFEIEGDRARVLRIPIWHSGGAEVRKNFLERYVSDLKTIPKEIPHVEIIEQGEDSSFLIVTKVHGDTSGRTFLQEAPAKPSKAWKEKESRLRHLTSLYMKRTFPTLRKEDITDSGIKNNARQFIWDTKRKDWILVDWDPILTY